MPKSFIGIENSNRGCWNRYKISMLPLISHAQSLQLRSRFSHAEPELITPLESEVTSTCSENHNLF